MTRLPRPRPARQEDTPVVSTAPSPAPSLDRGDLDAGDRVLLVDIENMIGPVRPAPAVIRRKMTALLEAAGDVHHTIACFGSSDSAEDPTVSTLAEMGVAPWPVPHGRDAAELALLNHVKHVHDRGGRTFVVASGDHRFSAVRTYGRLEILVWDGQNPARKLVNAAHEVHRVPPPADVPATPAGPDTAQAVEALLEDRELLRRHDLLKASPATSSPSTSRPSHSSALLAGLTLGVGIGIGQRLVDALLPSRR